MEINDESVKRQENLEKDNLVSNVSKKSSSKLFILIILLLVAVGIISIVLTVILLKHKSTPVASSNEGVPIIGLSLATLKEERWQRDRDAFVKKVESLGAKANVVSADADPELQKSQIESLILQGVSVLVVVPQDDKAIAPLITEARKKGIKVIAYDRLVSDSNLDGYVTVDYVNAGEQQAQGVLDITKKGNFAIIMGASDDSTVYMQKKGIETVLDPYIKDGSVKIVYEDFTTDWKPEVAYENMKKLLITSPNLSGVISMNDGMAFGIVKALGEKGLAGKIPVSGMDAELAGCQRIVEGTQTQTSYLPISLEADKAAELAVDFAHGKALKPDDQIKNGAYNIPEYLVQPVSVTKANMIQTIIKDGFHTFSDVYQNVPANMRPSQN